MSHWRDGGIGNMAGSDDRPIEEWTLLEKLAELAEAPVGGPMPKCLGPNEWNWAPPLKAIVREAFDEIESLRAKVERYEKTLRIIAGSSDLIQASQAKGALTNIGPKV